MEFSEYQEKARNTAIYPKDQGLYYTTLGLVGEAGEIANKVKKVIRDDGGQITDKARSIIANEIGDALWYIANLSFELNIELDMIAHQNLMKLSARQETGTTKGSEDDRGQIKDIASLMSQSILKKGDVVQAFNNYIVKSKDYGKAMLIEQKSVSQSIYHGYHPELWTVDINGRILDCWVLPQDKIKQEEAIMPEGSEGEGRPTDTEQDESLAGQEAGPTVEEGEVQEEDRDIKEAEEETAAAEEEAAPTPEEEVEPSEETEPEEVESESDAPSEEEEAPSEPAEESAPETEQRPSEEE